MPSVEDPILLADDSQKESASFVPAYLSLKDESEYKVPELITADEYEKRLQEQALVYFLLLDFIPDAEKRKTPYWLYGAAFGISIFSSFYNKDFTKNFTKKTLDTLNIPFSAQLSGICGWASLLVNLFIGVQTLVDTYYKCTEELPEKYKNANSGYYTDKIVRAFIISSIFASIIGVAPNLVFTYDTFSKKKSPMPFIVFNLFIQIIAVGTMNLRGITNIIEIDIQRKKAAQKTRLKILKALNETLPVNQKVSDKDLILLSKSELYHRKHRKLRHVLEGFAGVLPVFYCLGFFAAAVTFFSPLLVGAGLLMQSLMALNMLVGVISFTLKIIFLAYANISLVQMLLGIGDKSILDIPGLEDFRELPTALIVISLVLSVILSLLALGGPAAVIYNYLVPNIPISYGGGFIAGFGVNTKDTFALSTLIISTIYFRIKALIEGVPYEQKIMPWQHKGDFVQSRMKCIAQMKDAEVLNRFTNKELDEGRTVKENNQQKEIGQSSLLKAKEPAEEKIIIKNNEPKEIEEERKPVKAGDKIYQKGIKYTENDAMKQLLKVCDSLKTSSENSYGFFKENYYEKDIAFEKVGVNKDYVENMVVCGAT